MREKSKTPIDGYRPGPIALRFAMAFFFGCIIDLSIFFILFELCPVHFFLGREPWLALIGIPILWGLCGIFWLDQMLELSRRLTEGWLGAMQR